MRYYLTIAMLVFVTYISAQVRDFTMVDSKGTVHNLFTELDAGKVVVLDFFGTTCESCQLGVPELESIWQDLINEGELGQIWAIEANYRNDSAINAFQETYNASYPAFSIIDDDSIIMETTGYHVPYTPYYYVISPDYKIHNVGLAEVRPMVRKFLGLNSIDNTSNKKIYTYIEQGTLFIKNKSEGSGILQSFLYNTNGQLLTQGSAKIDVAHLRQGVYILKIISSSGEINSIKISI